MVSTRNHPSAFSPPDLTPTKSPRSAGALRKKFSYGAGGGGPWTHAPTSPLLLWLLISLPLVIWDTAYVLLRPHSMPGGALHSPLFTPYALYGQVDYIYGEKAYAEKNGFTAAQASLNFLESAGYVGYLWVVWRYGDGYALSVMTLSKTVLYWSNEYFSGFDNVGHNDPISLLFLWIIPNGLWLIFPSYMISIFAQDILHGLSIASGDRSSTPARAVTPTKEE